MTAELAVRLDCDPIQTFRPRLRRLLPNKVVSMGLPASRMRIIALSATLPNAEDFGSFLQAEVFRFGDEYRPVPLQV